VTLTSDIRQFVLFRIGPEEYGLPIEKVSGIIRYEQATPVPRAPEIVEGIINLRGRVIPVVNLGQRLFGREFVPCAASRIVIAEGDAGAVGLAVDAASEVASIAVADILPPPETALSSDIAEAFDGVAQHDGRLVILLDLEKALPRGEYDAATENGLMEGDEDA
jgi:purine-binding chemotaxis protein CheW